MNYETHNTAELRIRKVLLHNLILQYRFASQRNHNKIIYYKQASHCGCYKEKKNLSKFLEFPTFLNLRCK